jgi:predicted flap endonuclease-1-like 5' DNA nuclease
MNNWLVFLIGVLIGLIIAWLIYLLFLRPRRAAAEADLGLKLENANREAASLKAQITGQKDLQIRLDGANSERDSLRSQLAGMKDLQVGLDVCRADTEAYKLEIERLNAELSAARVSVPALGLEEAATRAPAAVSLPAAEPEAPDDLRIVEGIGPVISALLNKNGIYTFAQLAGTSIEQLRTILDAGGPRFRIADPETWPAQAVLARDGNWDALKALQDRLKAGRRA